MMSQDSIGKFICILCGMLCCLGAGTIQAETQTLTARARFVSPLAISNPVDPDFGTLETGPAGRNFVLGTDGSISGTDAGAYVGGASAGSMVIHGSTTQKIDISARNLTDDGGITITGITCNYGDAGDTDCGAGISAASGPTPAGTSLRIGMDINTTTTHADGDTAAPTFDIVVTYN